MSLVPDYIKNLSPYKAGKPISEVQRELGIKNVIKLASNENPLGPSESVIKAIQSSLLDIALYPDPNGFYLRQKLADMFDLDIVNVVLGAGSEGIMATIMRTFLNSDDHILATKNSFIGLGTNIINNIKIGENGVIINDRFFKNQSKAVLFIFSDDSSIRFTSVREKYPRRCRRSTLVISSCKKHLKPQACV